MIREEGKQTRAKVRFNTVDLLIVAVIILTVFSLIAGGVFSERDRKVFRVTISLDEEEARQMSLAGVSADKGAKVLLVDGDEPLGVLETGFSSGSPAELTVRLYEGVIGRIPLIAGDAISVSVGKIVTKNAVIASIEEVSGS